MVIIIIMILNKMQIKWEQQPMAARGGLSMMFIEWESSVYSVVWLEYQNPSLRVNAAALWLTGWALLEEPRGRRLHSEWKTLWLSGALKEHRGEEKKIW